MEAGTVAVYEAKAAEWRRRRPARFGADAEELAADVVAGGRTADLGCGPGAYLQHLGRPVVALDAADAMVRLAVEAAPDACGVVGDLEALPIRRGALQGAFARASYLHVPRVRLPLALAELHRALTVGGPVALTFLSGDGEGALPDDDFPGRFFAQWRSERLADVLVGAGFAVERCEGSLQDEWIRVRARRARTLADTVGPDMRLLICGLNPSVFSADVGVAFARPGNRFWPAALAAGLVSRDRDARRALEHDAIGMTDLVKRATARADELTAGEYRDGLARVERLVGWLRPAAVCFVGLAGWRAAVDRRAVAGPQGDPFGGVPAYVMPSTSGLNARVTPTELAAHLRAALQLGIAR